MAWGPQGDTLAVAGSSVIPMHGPRQSFIVIYSVDSETVAEKSMSVLDQPFPFSHELCGLAWSPDGQQILVVRSLVADLECRGEFLLYDAALERSQELFLEGKVGYPSWSNDGKWIVYERDSTFQVGDYERGWQRQASGEVWMVEATGQKARVLLGGPAYNGQPAWRP